MKRFVEGDDRKQVALLPECVDDYIGPDNPVRIIDVFVDELNLAGLGFNGATPALTGRPSYHPGVMLKIYIYGYLNRVPSSRRLERECQRNVEMMWLTGRLAPDFKTIADFRRDNGAAIRFLQSERWKRVEMGPPSDALLACSTFTMPQRSPVSTTKYLSVARAPSGPLTPKWTK